jgi:hypothetical protein
MDLSVQPGLFCTNVNPELKSAPPAGQAQITGLFVRRSAVTTQRGASGD